MLPGCRLEHIIYRCAEQQADSGGGDGRIVNVYVTGCALLPGHRPSPVAAAACLPGVASAAWHKSCHPAELLKKISVAGSERNSLLCCSRHSLGGALATLCAFDIKQRCPCATYSLNVKVYTFGVSLGKGRAMAAGLGCSLGGSSAGVMQQQAVPRKALIGCMAVPQPWGSCGIGKQ